MTLADLDTINDFISWLSDDTLSSLREELRSYLGYSPDLDAHLRSYIAAIAAMQTARAAGEDGGGIGR